MQKIAGREARTAQHLTRERVLVADHGRVAEQGQLHVAHVQRAPIDVASVDEDVPLIDTALEQGLRAGDQRHGRAARGIVEENRPPGSVVKAGRRGDARHHVRHGVRREELAVSRVGRADRLVHLAQELLAPLMEGGHDLRHRVGERLVVAVVLRDDPRVLVLDLPLQVPGRERTLDRERRQPAEVREHVQHHPPARVHALKKTHDLLRVVHHMPPCPWMKRRWAGTVPRHSTTQVPS